LNFIELDGTLPQKLEYFLTANVITFSPAIALLLTDVKCSSHTNQLKEAVHTVGDPELYSRGSCPVHTISLAALEIEPPTAEPFSLVYQRYVVKNGRTPTTTYVRKVPR
jgi:hypothetical protein